jgi:hypothetical protein
MLIPLPECETRGCLLRTLEFYHGKRSKKVRQPSLSANRRPAVKKNRFISTHDFAIQTPIAFAARQKTSSLASRIRGQPVDSMSIRCRNCVVHLSDPNSMAGNGGAIRKLEKRWRKAQDFLTKAKPQPIVLFSSVGNRSQSRAVI